jgi:hypothetical protein
MDYVRDVADAAHYAQQAWENVVEPIVEAEQEAARELIDEGWDERDAYNWVSPSDDPIP